MAFTASLSAQTMPSVSTDDVKKVGMEAAADQNPELEKQITDALSKDEGLQKETVNYLKENPENVSTHHPFEWRVSTEKHRAVWPFNPGVCSFACGK